MIEAVEVGGFKPLGGEPVTVECRPLTLLVGPNSTGKSSLMEAAALLVQSIRVPGRTGLLLEGPLVNLGADVTRLYHGGNVEQPLRVSVSVRRPGTDGPVRVWFAVRWSEAWIAFWNLVCSYRRPPTTWTLPALCSPGRSSPTMRPRRSPAGGYASCRRSAAAR
jgi:hypothetical protein